MKWLLCMAIAATVVAVPTLRADDTKEQKKPENKDNISAKLVGTWEVAEATDEVAVGATVVFKKDGKFVFTLKVDGQEVNIEGTYKIEDGKLHTTANVNGEEHSDVDTFEKLTDNEIKLKDTQGKITVLKRKKG